MSWTSILGQPTAARVLQADVIRNRLAPAYLFVGPEGVGKRLTAMELAKTVSCERPLEGACDECAPCRRISRGVHPDVHGVVPQGGASTIAIDQVRWVLERVSLRPFFGRRSMVIVDGAHRLTDEAANSFLKALEEPPGQATFLLLTSQPARCLPTILSRARTVRFRPLDAGVIEEVLVTRHNQPRDLATRVSRLAQGSLSRALALCEEWEAYQAIHAQVAAGQASAWLRWPVPKEREALMRWLDVSIARLRDVAVASLEEPPPAPLSRERCIETAFRMMELRRSFEEQMLSPRLVGTLLRESWINLLNV
jgi:DNA polymerase III delta' subunit